MSNIISLIVGGTVDITAHEKLGEHKIAELCKAMGDDCGGTSVDKEFLQIQGSLVDKSSLQVHLCLLMELLLNLLFLV
jgi:hypothetical protein